jgi:metal-sulfur cluster biosynthetic enzyme
LPRRRNHPVLGTQAEVKELADTSTATLTSESVYEALKDVYDPEIPVNVVDLGLIYNVDVEEGDVHVEMTLTAQGCGMGPYIAQQAEWRIAEMDDVEDVEVDIVFDPPWNPEMITEDGKRLLGID